MRAGDTASYGPVQSHEYGPIRLTFECQDSRFLTNKRGLPVRQWLFHVVASTDEGKIGGFLFVSIVDQTETRIPHPFEDWETCEEVLIKAGTRVDTTKHGRPNADAIPPAEATCDDVVLRRMDDLAQYSTESATVTGALFRALEESHHLTYHLEPTDEVIA